jgi:hypothetical protein
VVEMTRTDRELRMDLGYLVHQIETDEPIEDEDTRPITDQ